PVDLRLEAGEGSRADVRESEARHRAQGRLRAFERHGERRHSTHVAPRRPERLQHLRSAGPDCSQDTPRERGGLPCSYRAVPAIGDDRCCEAGVTNCGRSGILLLIQYYLLEIPKRGRYIPSAVTKGTQERRYLAGLLLGLLELLKLSLGPGVVRIRVHNLLEIGDGLVRLAVGLVRHRQKVLTPARQRGILRVQFHDGSRFFGLTLTAEALCQQVQ